MLSVSEAGEGVIARRVVLVNPTKFLGNLMIAGRLLQTFADQCRRNDVELLLVLDRRYRALLDPALPGVRVVWYPRDALVPARRPGAWKAWWLCVRAIRRFRADLAFPIEDDSVAHQLTRLSGARHRVGNSRARSSLGLHEVVPVQRSDRPIRQRHVWFAYREVFERLGMAASLPEQPCYMHLPVSEPPGSDALLERLATMGVRSLAGCVVLHAGATKRYKMWPVAHFTELAR
ncbi:MAG: glycosyltransferase family 9 protein, partial [Pseudomonadota bacterium]